MATKCKVDNLGHVIANELQLYTTETQYLIAAAVDKRAAEMVDMLKSTSPRRNGKGGGKYAKSWKSKVEQNGFSYYRRKVYNDKHYRLTHLLENGHAKKNGGRVSGKPHIKPARDAIEKEFEQDVLNAIGEGSGLRSNNMRGGVAND